MSHFNIIHVIGLTEVRSDHPPITIDRPHLTKNTKIEKKKLYVQFLTK